MSADRGVLTEIDLESGIATIETEISLESHFENGECRLTETADEWQGFEREELDDKIVY